MKDNIAIFIPAVDSFYKKCLSKFGYTINSDETGKSDPTTFPRRFLQPETGVRFNISLLDFEDGRYCIQVSMHKDERGEYGGKKHFALSTYINNHVIPNFPVICNFGENFEVFTKRFFDNLTIACETYLHDQFAGVSFEEHDPMPGRV